MIIYNVTCSVDSEIADEWISWMKTKHIPELIKAGLFDNYKILKIISHEDETNRCSVFRKVDGQRPEVS
jgi:hypothetical protein